MMFVDSNLMRIRSSRGGFSLLEAIIIVAITVVLATLTAKNMFGAVYAHRMDTSAKQVAALAQLARERAMGRNTRFRVTIDTTNSTYQMEWCNNKTANTCGTNAASDWTLDTLSGPTPLNPGVFFSVTGLTNSPSLTGQTSPPALSTVMSFNSRGVLWNESASASQDSACFYLKGASGTRPYGVCSTLAGKTTVYRYSGSVWEAQ